MGSNRARALAVLLAAGLVLAGTSVAGAAKGGGDGGGGGGSGKPSTTTSSSTSSSTSSTTTTVPTSGGTTDLAITQDVQTTVVRDDGPVGGPMTRHTITLDVTNLGNRASGIVVVDQLPAEASRGVSVTTSAGSCAVSGTGSARVVRCTLRSLEAGTSFRVVIVADPCGSGVGFNTATVSSDQDDLDPANNETSEPVASAWADGCYELAGGPI